MFIRLHHRPMLSPDRCGGGGAVKLEGIRVKPQFIKPGRPEVIKRIQVVDDNSNVLEAALEFFSLYKCWCRAVDPRKPIGPQVFSSIIKFKPDLIIMDGEMPDNTGTELIRELRTQQYPGYIAAYSANEEMNRSMLTAGADFALWGKKINKLDSVVSRF
jgi:CheY-like chemotaxis protein